ncbi:MAG: sulfatase [Acidobacteria bacterium]|nr:MAG: sulfatase [Acidobacteriota bacterium]
MNETRRRSFNIGLPLLGGWIVMAFGNPCGWAVGVVTESPSLPPIILISVDTLRADRLSCYGYRGQMTPHIDAIAKSGTLFSQVSSQVPLTLPSHVSLFTSTYPFSNGLRDNGQRLGPNAVTLATVLRSRGYRTAAFVGSYVLDQRFGLSQGFDFYNGPFDLHRRMGVDAGDAKRLGEDVVGVATRWIAANSNEPFFAFLHLYDLHKPYDLPSTRRKRRTEGYQAQLGYEDEVLGNFWSFLADRGLLERSLIVFTSDHGESLGDHRESTHGYFIYQSTLRVPLIIRWPAGSGKFLAQVDEPASLLDVAPTVLQSLGAPLPSSFQGRSLLGAARQKGIPANAEIYGESFFARSHFGCSALRSLRQGQFKYIEAPKPELYDLAKDPEEAHNIYTRQKSVALALREHLLTLSSRFQEAHAPALRDPSVQAEAALRSLGYLSISSPRSSSPDSGADPKDRIVEAETYHLAVALASSGKLEESTRLLERLRVKLPEVTAIPMSLGLNQQKMGKQPEAAEHLRAALKSDLGNVEAHYNLAVSLLALNQVDEAIKELQAVLNIEPYHSRAYYVLGTVWMQRKDYRRTRECFNRMLEIAPEDYAAHYHLGVLATIEEKWQEGKNHLLLALKTDPESPEAYNALGSLFFREGNLNEARDAFFKAIRFEPKFAWAHYNLGLVLQQQKENREAARHFRLALLADAQFQKARNALDQLERSSK